MKIQTVIFLCLIALLGTEGCKQHDSSAKAGSAATSNNNTKTAVIIPNLSVTYKLVPTDKDYLKGLDITRLTALRLINRVDVAHLFKLDSVILPDSFYTNTFAYCPFPVSVKATDSVKRIIFFSYFIEAFAAYENGQLVRWGPISLGKKSTPTPTGVFFTNWKSKKTTSTFNDEWIMEWYFNLRNFSGVSMHEYEMPGVPASHACVRLLHDDAVFFYSWCNTWKLDDKGSIAAYGTPVIIFGDYPFGKRKPWLSLSENNKAMNITEADLTKEAMPCLQLIMDKQLQREAYDMGKQ